MNDLKAFLDGELDAAAAGTMQARIQSDGTLAAAAGDFRRMSASFAALAVGPVVTGREKVMAAISKPKPSAFPWRTAGAVAGMLFLTVVVINVFPIFAQSKVAAERSAATVESAAPGEAEAPNALLESEDIVGRPSAPSEPQANKAGAGAPSRAGDTSLAPSPQTTPELFERKVIRTASLTVRVKSIETAERDITKWVDAARGYVDNTTSNNLDGRTPSMTITVRVPQARFSEALSAFEKLGERTAKDIQSSDVTQQIVDMEARLKNLRSQEETYRAILRTARRVGEIIDVQQRLSAIRGEIESMQAQRDAMAKLAALSTISVTLDQRPPPEEAQSGGWVEDTWGSATHALGQAFRSLSVIGIWILVYAPLWIPLGLVSVWGWRRALRA